MSLFLYVCEANLWTLDAPGYCEGDVVRDRWTPARCTQAPTAPLPVHLWSILGRWVAPRKCFHVGRSERAGRNCRWQPRRVCT